MLGPEKEHEIAVNLKSYSKRFEQLDESIRNQQDTHLATAKQGVLNDWNAWVACKKAELASAAVVQKIETLMRNRYPAWAAGPEDDVVETSVEVEEILAVEEEPYLG